MNGLRSILPCVLSALLLGVIVRELNHAMSPAALSLFAAGIPVTFAALRLDFPQGWKATFLIGLCADANAPVRFGLHAFLFLVSFLLIHRARQRVLREEPLVGTVIAMVANAALYLALTFALALRSPEPSRLIGRFLCELGVSSLLVGLVAPWYFSLTEHLLAIAGVHLRRETRSLY